MMNEKNKCIETEVWEDVQIVYKQPRSRGTNEAWWCIDVLAASRPRRRREANYIDTVSRRRTAI